MVSFMLTPGEAELGGGVKKSSKIKVRPRQKMKAGPGRDHRFIPTHLPHVLLILANDVFLVLVGQHISHSHAAIAASSLSHIHFAALR